MIYNMNEEDEYLRIILTCMSFKGLTGSELYVFELAKELVKMEHEVFILTGSYGEPLATKARKLGINVHLISEDIGDDFDIIHISHKPIGQQVLNKFPNIPAVMHIHSEIIPQFEEPIIHPNIKKYFSIRPSVREYIKSYGVLDDQIVDIVNPIDNSRFNLNHEKNVNKKEIILFVGTLDYLRRNMLFELKKETKENNQILWIVGANNGGYAQELLDEHVKYFGVITDVENIVKKCDYTAGIMLGRTTLEGYMCGKKGWIYNVDKQGNILSKVLTDIPDNINDYKSDVVANKINEIYFEIV